MRVTFLCSSLELGRDGVGDYTRMLATACRAHRLYPSLVAFNDPHLKTALPVEEETVIGPQLRLPPTLSWQARGELLFRFLQKFNPDWLSWQIVGYGFHPKGIIPRKSHGLLSAARGRRSQVMLHELWIGLAREDLLRNKFWGIWQRRALRRFLRDLRPDLVHTSNPAYQLALRPLGWTASVLPLFGNILVAETHDPESALRALPDFPSSLRATPRSTFWVGTIFGTVHPQWDIGATLAWLQQAARATEKRLLLLCLGRLGQAGRERLLAYRQQCPHEISLCLTGELPTESISGLLQAADFGLCLHPWALAGKSGAAAAMFDHGLPVLVPRDDWSTASAAAPVPSVNALATRLTDLEPTLFSVWLKKRRLPAPQLPAVTSGFIESLADSIGKPLSNEAA